MLSLLPAPSLSGSAQIPSPQGRLPSLPLGEVSLPSWVELSQSLHFTALSVLLFPLLLTWCALGIKAVSSTLCPHNTKQSLKHNWWSMFAK